MCVPTEARGIRFPGAAGGPGSCEPPNKDSASGPLESSARLPAELLSGPSRVFQFISLSALSSKLVVFVCFPFQKVLDHPKG